MPWWWCNLIFFFILIYRYAFGSNAFSICPWTTLILTLRQTDFFVQKINFTAINGLTDLKWPSGSLISSDDDLILKMTSRPLIGHLNRFLDKIWTFGIVWYCLPLGIVVLLSCQVYSSDKRPFLKLLVCSQRTLFNLNFHAIQLEENSNREIDRGKERCKHTYKEKRSWREEESFFYDFLTWLMILWHKRNVQAWALPFRTLELRRSYES
mgnify:CR=1 FL=1